MKRKIGIMGGTFDPIHIGHLILGEVAYEQFELDKVRFVPAGNPPHKRNRDGRATDEQRISMVRDAIAGNDRFELSLAEMVMDGLTYTYRTLEFFLTENPQDELYFIIGADSLFDFEKWMKPDKICQLCKLIVATRNQTADDALNRQIEHLEKKYGGTFLKLNTPDLDISSKMLRGWVKKDKSIRYYVPETVRNYIKENNMYKDCI